MSLKSGDPFGKVPMVDKRKQRPHSSKPVDLGAYRQEPFVAPKGEARPDSAE
jgi:hypothetical protein